MAFNEVHNYQVWYRVPPNETTEIRLLLDNGAVATVPNLSVAAASFMVDLLRHEKPLWWDGTARTLFTATFEPVGEGE